MIEHEELVVTIHAIKALKLARLYNNTARLL